MSNIMLRNRNDNLKIKKTKIIRYDPKTKSIVESKTKLLLLDVSGSMNEQVYGKRKIDRLREIIDSITGIEKYVFSDKVTKVNFIPEPQGNTDMILAFKTIKYKESGIKRMILISDGRPDNPDSALIEGKSLNIPIDIIFIGNRYSDGESFMKRLALDTGGDELTIDTKNNDFQKQFDNGIKGLLYGYPQ